MKSKLPNYREITKKIPVKVFPYMLHVVITTDVLEAIQLREDMFGEIKTPKGMAAFHLSAPGNSFIFLRHDASEAVIAHEAFHFVWSLCEHIGAKHEEEIMAYLLWFAIEQIVQFISEKWLDTPFEV